MYCTCKTLNLKIVERCNIFSVDLIFLSFTNIKLLLSTFQGIKRELRCCCMKLYLKREKCLLVSRKIHRHKSEATDKHAQTVLTLSRLDIGQ